MSECTENPVSSDSIDEPVCVRLDHLVDSTSRRHPDAVALETADGHTLTYRSLVVAAERVCHAVAGSGVRIPNRIGLVASKSVEAYVAYLAILKLGATIVPISSRAPLARQRTMVQCAGLSLILADQKSWAGARELENLAAVSVVPSPTADPAPDPVPFAREEPQAAGEATAYVLFTSGSTGRPKGVPISHANALSFVRYIVDRHRPGPGDRMTQIFDFSFDPSIYDLFVAWGSGATLVIPGPTDVIHPVRWVSSRRISHWMSVPSIISMAAALRGLPADSMPSLRLSLFCGEQLTVEQAEAWMRASPAGTIENAYGPTELTVTVTAHRLAADMHTWPRTSNGTIPIGQPYPGHDAIVVNDGRETDEGELCIRGAQRFAGYLDPQENAGRFLRAVGGHLEPLRENCPPKPDDWYRTGDLVRRDGDGTLTHLGRLDSQVKIHGFRVELHEIEGALRLHPEVIDAVVVAISARLGGAELAAYILGGEVDPRELRAMLVEILPEYMVPPRIRRLEMFPLTSNGKVDRPRLASMATEIGARRAEGRS
ncbi:amino acid adenylation domain-containing protein [Frankia sp. CcI49]|uniref:amino acid adenylation domain-containing protein n=1 Tax=Frankia sp. CcI49 TaxID=1745382 RepID=UPI0018E9D03D|nr:amino acid adenylation domain-containing protein [Frankia sp. CcI49]